MEIKMYKNYVFDLYGTLIDINTDEYSMEFWDKASKLFESEGALYTPTELKNCYNAFADAEKNKVERENPGYKKVDIQLEKVFGKLFENKGIIKSEKEILKVAKNWRSESMIYIKLYDGVIDMLDSFKEKGKKIYLLSNAQRCFTLYEIETAGLLKYFDGIIISSDVNCAKPDRNIFQFLVEKYKLNKKETLMIGNDYISDIRGAHNAGIDSLYIHQSISPEIKGKLWSKWSIMDGDVYKIKEYVLL